MRSSSAHERSENVLDVPARDREGALNELASLTLRFVDPGTRWRLRDLDGVDWVDALESLRPLLGRGVEARMLWMSGLGGRGAVDGVVFHC